MVSYIVSSIYGIAIDILSKKKTTQQMLNRHLVPPVGLEPTRYRYRGILSPLRLPIPSRGRSIILYDCFLKCNRWKVSNELSTYKANSLSTPPKLLVISVHGS